MTRSRCLGHSDGETERDRQRDRDREREAYLNRHRQGETAEKTEETHIFRYPERRKDLQRERDREIEGGDEEAFVPSFQVTNVSQVKQKHSPAYLMLSLCL